VLKLVVVLHNCLLFEEQTVVSVLALFLVLLNFECEVSSLLFQPTNLPLEVVDLFRFLLVSLQKFIVLFGPIFSV